MPTRSWVKNGVPPVTAKIPSAASATTGAVTINSRIPTTTSTDRLIACQAAGTRRSTTARTATCTALGDLSQQRAFDGTADLVEPIELAQHPPWRGRQMQKRNVLARVIGTRRGRVAAVIGGYDHLVTSAQSRFQLRQQCIELRKRRGIASGVATMAVLRI